MKLLALTTLLLAALPATLADEPVDEPNRPCNKEGAYTCSDSKKEVLVCGNGRWQISAVCDGAYCVRPAGATVPWCQTP